MRLEFGLIRVVPSDPYAFDDVKTHAVKLPGLYHLLAE